jgi:tetratricopeptide (TPR) repeat protein
MPPVLALFFALLAGAGPSLDEGAKALADFKVEDAAAFLEKALKEGPYALADHARLYEQRGIAFAYLDRPDDALSAFDLLLALDPGRAIRYTLSPKVTLLFEEARKRSADRVAPKVELRWDREQSIAEPVPIDVDVIADPLVFLKSGALFWRLRGAAQYESVPFELPPVAGSRRVMLPAPAPGAERGGSLEVYLLAYDAKKNEVLSWGSATRPRELQLAYLPPDAWYSKWWVWTLAGVVIAGGTGAAVFAATRSTPSTIDANARLLP